MSGHNVTDPDGVLDVAPGSEHEDIVITRRATSGLRAIIAIHSTLLGPSLGGARFYPYADETLALHDVLRLSRAMTAKAALAGLDHGGGKAVIIGDPGIVKTPALLRDFAAVVNGLNGRYITAEDVGTTQHDMDLIHETAPFVAGTSTSRGGSGDPSPATALGVVVAMEAAAARRWGTGLEGKTVLVPGRGQGGRARHSTSRPAARRRHCLGPQPRQGRGGRTSRRRPHGGSLRCSGDTR